MTKPAKIHPGYLLAAGLLAMLACGGMLFQHLWAIATLALVKDGEQATISALKGQLDEAAANIKRDKSRGTENAPPTGSMTNETDDAVKKFRIISAQREKALLDSVTRRDMLETEVHASAASSLVAVTGIFVGGLITAAGAFLLGRAEHHRIRNESQAPTESPR